MKQYIIATIVFCIIIGLIGFAGGIGNNYVREDCKVVKVFRNITTIEDKSGHLWEYEGAGYKVGQRVDLYMHNNHTDNTIADDYIIEVKEINK